MNEQVIRVYVCPDCENYYGASSMGRLEAIPNRNLKGEIMNWRNKCPDCGGNRVPRWAKLIPPEDVEEARRSAQATVTAKRASPVA